MQKVLIAILLTLHSLPALALTVKATCRGLHQGEVIVFNGQSPGVMAFKQGSGSLSISGRPVARFDGDDLSINYLLKTFSVSNGQGDEAFVKITSLRRMTGVIRQLSIPAYGINWKNINMRCVQK